MKTTVEMASHLYCDDCAYITEALETPSICPECKADEEETVYTPMMQLGKIKRTAKGQEEYEAWMKEVSEAIFEV